jgi:hypothetical protein
LHKLSCGVQAMQSVEDWLQVERLESALVGQGSRLMANLSCVSRDQD